MEIGRIGDLEIDQNISLQRREWRAQRIGWVIMLLLVCAAAAGLCGGTGPLATGHVFSDEETLRISFGRFERQDAPDELRIEAAPAAIEDNTLRLWVSRDYLDGVNIERIVPEPSSSTVGRQRVLFEFDAEPSGEAVEVVFHLKTQHIGVLNGRVGLDNGPEVSFRQFIYP